MPLYFRNVVYFVAILLVYTQYFYTLMLILDGICQIFEKIRNEIPPPPKKVLYFLMSSSGTFQNPVLLSKKLPFQL